MDADADSLHRLGLDTLRNGMAIEEVDARIAMSSKIKLKSRRQQLMEERESRWNRR